MRLVAIYIKDHFLFKKGVPQTINFGGEYIYIFDSIDDQVEIKRIKNTSFINNFWGENILLVSAIVGSNGSGKTSVLEVINQSYRKRNKCLFIYESIKENKVFCENRIADFDENDSVIENSKIKILKTNFEITEVKNNIQKLYYSSSFDEKILDFHSPLNINSKYTKIPLSTIYSNNLRREVIFLQSKTSDIIKSIYEDFPKYDYISISANTLYKRDLENLYLGTNLGYTNIIEKFRTDIKWQIDKTNERIDDKANKKELNELNRLLKFQEFLIYITEKDRLFSLFEIILNNVIDNQSAEDKFFKIFDNENFNVSEFNDEERKQILRLINYLKQFSVTDVLREFWDMYPNTLDSTSSHLIHDGKNLIKNLEINILSLITVNDVFQINGLQGSFDIKKVLKEKDFIKMMNKYLEKYLIQKHSTLYKSIISKIEGDLDVLIHSKIIIDLIKSDKFSKEGGVETTEPKMRMIEDVEGFLSIIEFYNYIKGFAENDDSKIDLSVKDFNTTNILNKIFEKYENVKLYFSKIALVDTDIIQFGVDKNLSYGQKSLLNLYSIFYDFTLEKDFIREKQSYLLLLDEGDLGYHALWKRKYVDAITKALPVIFNRLKPKVFDGKKYINSEDENPTVQIILTTHDSLTLSDIPNNNVVYLDKKEEITIVLNGDERPQKSFGANITDLLADSFFIKDGLIGDFAKNKINEVLISLLSKKKINLKRKDEIKKIINIVDEPIIKMKLQDLYKEKFNEVLDKEARIKMLQEELEKLQND